MKSQNPRSTRRNPNLNAIKAQEFAGRIAMAERLSQDKAGHLAGMIENNLKHNRPALQGTAYSANPAYVKITTDPVATKPTTHGSTTIPRRGKPAMKKQATPKTKAADRAVLGELLNGILPEALLRVTSGSPVKRKTTKENAMFDEILESLTPEKNTGPTASEMPGPASFPEVPASQLPTSFPLLDSHALSLLAPVRAENVLPSVEAAFQHDERLLKEAWESVCGLGFTNF